MIYLDALGVSPAPPSSGEMPLPRQVAGPADAHALFSAFEDADREKSAVFYLDAGLAPRFIELAAVGGPAAGLPPLRSVFRAALLLGAAHFLVVRNHILLEPAPTVADRGFMEEAEREARTIGIGFADFVIAAKGGFWSMRHERAAPPGTA